MKKKKNFTNEELARLSMGKFANNPFDNPYKYLGTVGETCQSVKQVEKYLILVDGPAGIRIAGKYGVDEKGKYHLSDDVIRREMRDFMSSQIFSKFDMPENNRNRKHKIYYSYCTAIPIGTALAQSFNEEFLEKIGKEIIGEEMDLFDVQVWLAPGMNIHRNILNERNLQYFSEDLLLSGKMAASLSRGFKLVRIGQLLLSILHAIIKNLIY